MKRETFTVPHDSDRIAEYDLALTKDEAGNTVVFVEYIGRNGGHEPIKLQLTAGDIRALLARHARDRYTNRESDYPQSMRDQWRPGE